MCKYEEKIQLYGRIIEGWINWINETPSCSGEQIIFDQGTIAAYEDVLSLLQESIEQLKERVEVE